MSGGLLGGNQYFDLSARYENDPDKLVGFESQDDGIEGLKSKMYYSTLVGNTNISVIEVGADDILISTNSYNTRTVFNSNGIVIPPIINDPSGEPGAIYYNTSTKTFRGYVDSSWKNLSFQEINETPLGNIGIGTATPAYKLDVTQASDGIVASFADDDNNCTIDPDTIGGITCTSDERKKTDIADFGTALDIVKALHPVRYAFKTTPQERTFGFLAQEVRTILPELVQEGTDGYLTLSYSGFTPVLVKAIQELNMKVSEIQKTGEQSSLVSILGNASNGITRIFTDRLDTKQLCVEDVCVDRGTFLKMVQEVTKVDQGQLTSPDPNITTPTTPTTVEDTSTEDGNTSDTTTDTPPETIDENNPETAPAALVPDTIS